MLLSILNPQSSKLFRGFTLSEVLITIGIIGVVASLVLPTLFQTINDKELVSQYLKSHTVLTNAYKETEAVEGYKLYQLSEDDFAQLYESHLKTMGCDEYDVCLVDGMGYDYETDENNYVTALLVDTNGIKKPNVRGKDLYRSLITEKGLVPEGESIEYCFGYDCGKYVLAYHKLFEIIDYCVEFNANGCSRCQDGYKLESNSCTQLETPNCIAYNGENCSSCTDGYSPNTSGSCTTSVANCGTYSIEGCETCADSYSKNTSGTCTANISNCNTYSTSGCSSCRSGYSVNTSGTCTANVSNCATYSTSGCSACKQYYRLVSGKCSYIYGGISGGHGGGDGY